MKRGLAGLSRGGFDPQLLEYQLRHKEDVAREALRKAQTRPAPPEREPKPRARPKRAAQSEPLALVSELARAAEVGWACPFCQRQNTESRPVAGGSMTCKHCCRLVPIDHID